MTTTAKIPEELRKRQADIAAGRFPTTDPKPIRTLTGQPKES